MDKFVKFKNWLSQAWRSIFNLSWEQSILFLVGFLLIGFGYFLEVKSETIVLAGALLVLIASFDPASIKKVGGKNFNVERYDYSEKERKTILELSEKQATPEDLSVKKELSEDEEELIEAAEKRTEKERAPEDYLTLAIKAREDKNFAEGLGWAYSGLNLNPKNIKTQAALHNVLGMLFHDRKWYEPAEENYKKALKIDEKAYWVHNNLGSAYYNQKKYDEAEREYKEAIALNPKNMNAHYNLGTVYLEQEKHDDAEREYKEALRLDPKDVDTHYNLGTVYFAQKKYDDAEREYKEALRLEPNSTDTYNNLGLLYFDLERWEEARSQFDKALFYDEGLAESIAGKAITLLRLGREDEALEFYRKAVSLDPEFGDPELLKEEYIWPAEACKAALELIERL